jgi:RNA polymerase sigma-70 factor, ECF subfamily
MLSTHNFNSVSPMSPRCLAFHATGPVLRSDFGCSPIVSKIVSTASVAGANYLETLGRSAQYKGKRPGRSPAAEAAKIKQPMEESDILVLLEGRQYSEAFALLLERFKGKVFRLAFSIMRNETHAEDVAQDVFVKIWNGLPGYHGGASLSTWIYTITRNTCLTELTRRGRHPTVSLQEPEMESASELIPALQSEDPAPGMRMDVEILLAELPENYRRVITLFYLEQKAYGEVALMLGIPLGTVKTLLFRAKKELLRINSRQGRRSRAEAGPAPGASRQSPTVPPLIGLRRVLPLLKPLIL